MPAAVIATVRRTSIGASSAFNVPTRHVIKPIKSGRELTVVGIAVEIAAASAERSTFVASVETQIPMIYLIPGMG